MTINLLLNSASTAPKFPALYWVQVNGLGENSYETRTAPNFCDSNWLATCNFTARAGDEPDDWRPGRDSCADADAIAEKITNAGSVFIGTFSPESAGDYASGTNHTLPTNGFAKAYSGVSLDSFTKKITFQKLSYDGLKGIAESVIQMAEAEGLQAHAEAIRIRLKD